MSFCPLDGQPLTECVVQGYFIGKLLDNKYRLIEKIGEGGFGAVYRATHIGIDNTVAVKILHPHLASDHLSIERFRREARAAAQIHHPNAVLVTDFGVTQDEGTAYLVMEFLEGIDLRKRLKLEKQLKYPDAIALIIQSCDAVHAAHLKGIIHRDLKPDNIWITKGDDDSDFVKVLDFGIAKLKAGAFQAGTSAIELTAQGVIVGTPHYMSPEQGRGEELDPRSDVYSLGVILYEAVVGKVPFNGQTAIDVVLKHNTVPPLPPRRLRSDIPDRLERIILRALEKKKEQRQDSAVQLAEELRSVLFDFGVPLKSIRKRDLQSSGTSSPSQRRTSSRKEESTTKAFDFGMHERGLAPNEPPEVEQTLPVRIQQGSSIRPEPSPITTSPNAAGTIAAGSQSSVQAAFPGILGRKNRVYLYAGLSIVALMIVFAIIKFIPGKSPLTNANRPTATDKPPGGMVSVRGGKFAMGTNDPGDDYYNEATPAHEEAVGDFLLDTKEVTNEEYYQFIKASGRQPPSHWAGGEPDPSINQLPVTNVSWDDANEYAKAVGKRLPSEREWEYAARGSEGRIYPWGNDWDAKCSNSKEDQRQAPVSVGSYTRCPSPCGAYDMAGNVAEWVADDFSLYKNSKAKSVSGSFKVFRGGAYNVAKEELRTFIRWYKPAYYREPWLGFRCAKDAPKSATNP